MGFIRFHGRAATACVTLLALAACARSGPDEMSWARSALERNNKIEIVATDPQSRTFTVRQKDTGELRMVHADELVGAAGAAATPGAPAAAAPASTTPSASGTAATAAVPPTPEPPASNAAGGAAWVSESAPAPAEAAQPLHPGAGGSGGRVLEAGPGYSIKAASAVTAVTAVGGARARDAGVSSAAVERRHEPIICQGARMLQIDNRNLVFDGDAVSAEDGCEIHITNSHISASGVGVSARAANVHIDNSQIEGDAASIDASQGAQVYAESSRFRGMSRRLDTAAFHDLGGNVWN
jgi:hypothetical protein